VSSHAALKTTIHGDNAKMGQGTTQRRRRARAAAAPAAALTQRAPGSGRAARGRPSPCSSPSATSARGRVSGTHGGTHQRPIGAARRRARRRRRRRRGRAGPERRCPTCECDEAGCIGSAGEEPSTTQHAKRWTGLRPSFDNRMCGIKCPPTDGALNPPTNPITCHSQV
jgi:hypothetical protein